MNLVKRIGSAVLILLVLLNVLGYYGIFMGLDYQNNLAMRDKLDSGTYDERDEVEINIPLAVPYLPDAEDFDRVDGKFEYNGHVYLKVRQRYSQDTLYVVCVKDHTGTQIRKALTSYVKTFSDKPADTKHGAKTSLTFIKEYFLRSIQLEHRTAGWHYGLALMRAVVVFIPSFSASIHHPPE